MTIQEINQKITDIITAEANREQLQEEQQILHTSLRTLGVQLMKWEKLLKKEQQDVQVLNTNSLKSILTRLTNTMDEKLQKEQQDIVYAKMKLDDLKERQKDLEKDLRNVTTELMKIKLDTNRLDELKEQKRQLIIEQVSEHNEELQQLTDEYSFATTELFKINRLIRNCSSALSQISINLNVIASATNWSIFDALSTDEASAVAAVKKYEKMKELQQKLNGLRKAMSKIQSYFFKDDFKQELHFEIPEGFLVFDVWMDWIVQDIINIKHLSAVQKKLELLKELVITLQTKLLEDQHSIQQNLSELENKLMRLLKQKNRNRLASIFMN